ncbi:MAG: hypothetical protein IPG06_07805 [Haliea sp.]|nr:hypothetical protein [Haliea sp.]
MRWLSFVAFFAVIAHHLWFVYSHAINIPYHDDIYDFLRIVNLIETADGPAVAIKEWFSQYLDHRTSASRSLVYGAYLIEGEVNFHTLTLLANLALPFILLLFYLSVRSEEYRWGFLLISALLLLNLRAHAIILHSQAGFAYYYVFFYAFACLFALHKFTFLKFVLAAVLCSLATFTLASGQVVWLMGLASLLHQCLVTGRRSFMYPAIWLLLAITVLVLWRVGFVPVSTEIPSELTTRASAVSVSKLAHRAVASAAPDAVHNIFLVTLGSVFTVSSTLVAGSVGLVLLGVLSFVTIKLYRQEDLRLVLCCWFIVATAAAVTVGRAMIVAPDYILEERYSFFSAILMSTLALLVQSRFRVFRSPVVYLVVLLAVVYWAWTYRHFERPLQDILSGRYDDYNHERFTVFGKPQKESAAIVNQAIAAGIYNPPCRPYPVCETQRAPGE